MNINTEGFITVSSVNNYTPTTPVFTAESLAEASVVEAQPGEKSDFAGCNISFDIFSQINLNIPGFNLNSFESYPDLTLFDKADKLSYEISIINDLLINSIQDMNCCDIAKKYNHTMVPFFRYFADNPSIKDCNYNDDNSTCANPSSNNFISTLIDISKIIIDIQTVIEPLNCLIRPLPGNPWLPFDYDYLNWVYSYSRKASPYLNKIMSGEVLDIMINPITDLRKKLELCLNRNISNSKRNFFEVKKINDLYQLQRIVEVAKRDGQLIKGSNIIKPEPPKIPIPMAYPDNESFQIASDNYTQAKAAYDKKLLLYERMIRETSALQNQVNILSQFEINSLNTQNYIKKEAGTICDCVANSIGLVNYMPDWITIHSRLDVNNLIGKELGIKYSDVGIPNKFGSQDDKLIFIERYIASKYLKKIFSIQKAQWSSFELETVIKDIESPYSNISNESFQIKNTSITINQNTGTSWEAWNCNNNILDTIDKIKLKIESLNNDIKELEGTDRKNFYKKRELVEKAFNDVQNRLKTATTVDEKEELLNKFIKAQELYDSFFGSWNHYNPELDLSDWHWRSAFIDPNDTDYSINIKDFLAKEEYDDGIVATSIRIDKRTDTVFYNSGVTYVGGSLSWRLNNPLLLDYNTWTEENGAIGRQVLQDSILAAFPTIEKAISSTGNYIREKYNDKTIDDFANDFFSNSENSKNSKYSKDKFLFEVSQRNLNTNLKINNLSEIQMQRMIQEAARILDFKTGIVWYKGKKIYPEAFISPKFEIQDKITDEVINNISFFVQSKINDCIKFRGDHFEELYSKYTEINDLNNILNELNNLIQSNEVYRVIYMKQVKIPCTCDNFTCSLLQMVVSYILGLFNELLKYLTDMIQEYLVPDFIRNMIELMTNKLRCLSSILNIKRNLDIVENAADELLEDLKWRISLYPDDTCFIPDNFNDPSGNIDENDPGNPFTDPNSFSVNENLDSTLSDIWDDDNNIPEPQFDTPANTFNASNDNVIETGTRQFSDFSVQNNSDDLSSVRSLKLRLILTSGVESTGIRLPDRNIETLKYNCNSDSILSRYFSCGQKIEEINVQL